MSISSRNKLQNMYLLERKEERGEERAEVSLAREIVRWERPETTEGFGLVRELVLRPLSTAPPAADSVSARRMLTGGSWLDLVGSRCRENE